LANVKEYISTNEKNFEEGIHQEIKNDTEIGVDCHE